MTQTKLYPVNYIEPTPAAPPTTKDEAQAKALIEAAVPEGGDPLTFEQVRQIVCGRPGGNVLEVGVAPMEDIIAEVQDRSSKRGIRARPDVASLGTEDVRRLFDQVYESRKPTWTLNKIEPAEPKGEIR